MERLPVSGPRTVWFERIVAPWDFDGPPGIGDPAGWAFTTVAIPEGLGVGDSRAVIEVWNKTDLLEGDERDAILTQAARMDDLFAVSAITGAA